MKKKTLEEQKVTLEFQLEVLGVPTERCEKVAEKILEREAEVREEIKKLSQSKVIESCENCGEKGYGKAWYGRGRATGEAWGDRYVPTGSVVFCKNCKDDFKIGRTWNGEEIWKTTSDRPEHKKLRLSYISRKMTVDEILQSLNQNK